MTGDHGERLARVEARLCALEKRALEWVTRAEFTPVKLLGYGMISSILLTVLAALLRLVILGVPK